ncbi:MAG: GAF domain-containing protein [Chloroflexota bacterium]
MTKTLTKKPVDTSAILNAVISISNQRGVNEAATETSKQIIKLFNGDTCSISKWDKEKNIVKVWAEYRELGRDLPDEVYAAFNLEDYPLTQQLLEKGIATQVLVDDVNGDPAERKLLKTMLSESVLMLPLHAHDQIIGLVEVFSKSQPYDYSVEQISQIQLLAKYAGAIIEREASLTHANQLAVELEVLR